jgi:predicted ester cyclase
MRAAIERVGAGLSDSVFTVHAMVAEGDLVSVRLTSAATQTGPFMGLPPSGRRYEIEELHLFRLREGQVVEHWHQFDQLGMMRQLGAGPSL